MLCDPMEEGQGIVEYMLLIFLIAIFLFLTVALLGDELERLYHSVRNSVVGARKIGLPDNSPLLNGVIQH